MLGKLMKYELKATGRVLLPLYGAILLVSVLGAFSLERMSEFEMGALLFVLVYTGLCVALVVLTLVLIIQRFNRNLLKDEGYLMFTLPVSVHSLLFSKLFSALLWCALGGCVGLLSIALMTMIAMDASQWGEFWAVIHQLIHNVDLEIAGNLGLIGLLALMEGVSFLMTIYLSLSVGQIPTFNRYRGLMAFITFLVITVIMSWLTGIPAFLHAGDVSAFSPQAMVGLYILYDVVVSALFYGGTWLILTKKLNLE